jgi:hypothetical protein
MAKDKTKKDKKAKKVKAPVDPQVAAVDHVSVLTRQVRTLEGQLDNARLERRAAMRVASELGVTHYRIAKAAETSQSSATRMIRDEVAS